MAEEDMMGERPPMDAAMDMPTETRMPAEAVKRLMQPSEEIQAVLIARISNMAPEELRMLDSAITPDVARVLMKLLPELREIIAQIGQAPQRPPMGALGGM
tara:strand:- start:2009 stop:2311 length:303 start_codon:yes stop_codon:yes gene_type:complete